ncbi:hypothetical protein IAR50_000318 [Cryptococcus sp. DSM 104548]
MRATLSVTLLSLVATGVYSIPRPQLQLVDGSITADQCTCASANQAAISIDTAASPTATTPTGTSISEADCPCETDSGSEVVNVSDLAVKHAVRVLTPTLAESALAAQFASGTGSPSGASATGIDTASLEKAGLALLVSKYGTMLPSSVPTASAGSNLGQSGTSGASGQGADMDAMKKTGIALLVSKYGSMLPSASQTGIPASNLGQSGNPSASGQDVDMKALEQAGLALLASKYGTMLPTGAAPTGLPSRRNIPDFATSYGHGFVDGWNELAAEAVALWRSKNSRRLVTELVDEVLNKTGAAGSKVWEDASKVLNKTGGTIDKALSLTGDELKHLGPRSAVDSTIPLPRTETDRLGSRLVDEVLNETFSTTGKVLDKALSLPGEEIKLLGGRSAADSLHHRLVDEVLDETFSATSEIVDKAASLPAEEADLLKPSERDIDAIVDVSAELEGLLKPFVRGIDANVGVSVELGDGDKKEEGGDESTDDPHKAVDQKLPFYPPPGSF